MDDQDIFDSNKISENNLEPELINPISEEILAPLPIEGSLEEKSEETSTETVKPPKKKFNYLPWLIIIPILMLCFALGVAYWLISKSAEEEGGNGNESETEEEENGGESEEEEETEKPDLDLTEVSNDLREIEDAMSDIDETFELIDDSLEQNDDVPSL